MASNPLLDEAKYKDAKFIVITDFDGTITLLVSRRWIVTMEDESLILTLHSQTHHAGLQ